LRFTLDGRALHGFAGDTLASALLANGKMLIGRSFKYHRPRGFLSAGPEEPNGLFTLGTGGRTTPNVAGTSTELHEGLIAMRQNGWPSVDFDLMAGNSWAAPVLGAGFYYKTFMGPRRGSWMLYEPFIRRAAGLGRALHERDPDRYETRQLFTDVLVIGAGPAGLAAAGAAAQAGARVMLVEQDTDLGGRLLSSAVDSDVDRRRGRLLESLRAHPNLEILCRTTAIGVYDGNTVALVERNGSERCDPERGEAREIVITLHARAIVYATGAIERPLVFSDNDRPGVMLASAVQSYLHRFAVRLGTRAVVATNNDAAWRVAFELAASGSFVSILDQRTTLDGPLYDRAQQAGVTVETGALLTRAFGTRSVESVSFTSRDHPRPRRLDCDVVCMSGGWSPTVHLTSHTGIKPVYSASIDAFVPGGYAAGHFAAGAVTGDMSLAGALHAGRDAGLNAARHAGHTGVVQPAPALQDLEAPYRCEPARAPPASRGKAFIDFQNDVTVRDLSIAHQEGFVSVEHLKRYTTLGMGTDQGKTSNINAIRLMAAHRGLAVTAAGTTTFRPPYSPVSIGALAGRNVGQNFRPIRRSPLHDWHLANGAALIEAGPWLRAWYYRWAGESAESAYVQEMHRVRTAVGMADVSSLGKIDVQGPDAGEFLDRLYVNKFANLPVGKARYGVMLNDDATVLDDGTCARLAQNRYFMTTTTAHGDEVLSRLEFLLQTAWTDLDVHVVSATDEWCGMSIAGPQARAALELSLPDQDISDASLPYMACRETRLAGIPLRILRLSFSGELAYELYVPADHGVSLWSHILETAAPLGIRPYGLEALASLRIEKGHVAGLELDQRNTLDDLGLGKMAARDKPFVGRPLRERPELRAAQRWSLVGLECLEPANRLRGGSILFAPDDPIAGHGRGYVSSVTWSTALAKFIGLGLYQGGLRHEGAEVLCAYPLKGELVRARIVSPIFLDPKGERLRV
jgi:sarcosine oxidase subunit alpha